MGINYDVIGFNSVEETEMVIKKKKEKRIYFDKAIVLFKNRLADVCIKRN